MSILELKSLAVGAMLFFATIGEAEQQPGPSDSTGIAELSVCDQADPLVTKWKNKLGIENYQVELRCAAGTDYDPNLLGGAMVYPETRIVDFYINPRLKPDEIEEVVLHEMLHVLLIHTIKADSNMIHEQSVRTLTKVIMRKK